MKRYRVLSFDIDSRAILLTMAIEESWDEHVKEQHRQNQEATRQELLHQFGDLDAQLKLQNLVDIGPQPTSIVAFHNRFWRQIRTAFVMGAFYPALTASCALGERILNHLILLLRDDFRGTPGYRRVYRKDSFDDWRLAIGTLAGWGVLLPKAVEAFEDLHTIRNRAIHFRPDVDRDDRPLALDAIRCLDRIVAEQFPTMGRQSWFARPGVPGESYLAKHAEANPFVRRVYLPNSQLVGPRHRVAFRGNQLVPLDEDEYEDQELTDEEFCRLRLAWRSGS